MPSVFSILSNGLITFLRNDWEVLPLIRNSSLGDCSMKSIHLALHAIVLPDLTLPEAMFIQASDSKINFNAEGPHSP